MALSDFKTYYKATGIKTELGRANKYTNGT